jgi:hypothetical protein
MHIMSDPGPMNREVQAKVVILSVPSLKSMVIVPALPDRTWMSSLEATDEWLPTSIANQAGWMVLNDEEVEITWNGGRSPSDLIISCPGAGTKPRVVSRFGNGIATWRLPFLFHLPKEVILRLRGPANWHKEGAFPIEQILDSIISISRVSMNWRLTTIGKPVRFEVGEPLGMIYPELRGLAEKVDPQVRMYEAEIASERHTRSTYTNADVPGLPGREQRGEASQTVEDSNFAATPVETSFHPSEQLEVELTREIGGLSIGVNGQSSEAAEVSICKLPTEAFLVQDDFYDQATTLRTQFEQVVSSITSTDPATNPFTYAFCENAYQFIAASSERIFNANLLFCLLDRIRAWARQNLGATHASTPRVQLYIQGSHRNLAKDDIRVGWHYLFSLTRNEKQARRANVILESASEILEGVGFKVSRVERVNLSFNDFLVHDAKRLYGIDRVKGSANPIEGMLLLGGYLW